jgi:hypothetical protein
MARWGPQIALVLTSNRMLRRIMVHQNRNIWKETRFVPV